MIFSVLRRVWFPVNTVQPRHPDKQARTLARTFSAVLELMADTVPSLKASQSWVLS